MDGDISLLQKLVKYAESNIFCLIVELLYFCNNKSFIKSYNGKLTLANKKLRYPISNLK